MVYDGVGMLQEWYQPGHKSVWSEDVAFRKLEGLKLASEQQSAVDSGIRPDQWALRRDQQGVEYISTPPFRNILVLIGLVTNSTSILHKYCISTLL